MFIYFDFIFKILKIYSFLERGREEEREGEKHRCVGASCTPLTGDLACNPITGNRTSDLLVCRLALNPLSHTGQGMFVHLILEYTNK